MNFFAGLLNTLFERTSELLPITTMRRDLSRLSHDLLSARGEVSGMALAEQILACYRQSDDAEKLAFFDFLVSEMDFDIAAVEASLKACATDRRPEDYKAFIQAAEPRRKEFFRRLNEAPSATYELVLMRRDLLTMMPQNPQLEVIDIDLRELFISWFNRGFLVLRPIDWHSPAHILEKIIAYEAVHEISNWDELRRRLAPADRRCFAFFHPAMPEEPLIFVEVALSDSLPSSVQHILADGRTITPDREMDHAVFYSISNCQKGLAGISFGNSLIKTVVEELSQQFPRLKHFVTLSPMPGLSEWLNSIEVKSGGGKSVGGKSGGGEAISGAAYIKQNPDEGRSLAAAYLTQAKRDDGQPLDAVSRFHLGNGASIHEIHTGADTSPQGQKRSFGLMVNYLYEKDRLVENHEKFVRDGTVIARGKINDLGRKITPRIINRDGR